MKKILAAVTLAVLAACATNESFRQGRDMVENGNVEEGLARIEQAMTESPDDKEIRNFYLRNRAVAVQRYLAAGDNARASGPANAAALDQAEAAYASALRLEPDNARGREGLEQVKKDRASLARLAQAQAALKAGNDGDAYEKAKAILADNPSQREARAIVRRVEEKKHKETNVSPQLGAALKKPITIQLRDAPLRSVFELISKRSGLNFVFDKDLPTDLKTTVFVRDTSIEEVMKFILVTHQLERRVLNENTVLVYPNTPAKNQAYRELVVKSFFLGNADAKQTANMIRSLVKTRDLYVDEKLNMIVMRDTAEAVAIAEKLVANQDLADAEVMLEVEVLEIGQNLAQQVGIQWPTSVGVGVVGAAGVPGQLTGREARNINGGLVRLTISDPVVALNLRQQVGRTNVLANPRIRVKNKEKARIHIGDRVPVITTTAGATGFVSESVNYLDVGLKLEVEPQVSLDDDVGIKVGLEVSNIANQITTGSGTVAYQVGTRNAATTLRLKDGETQVLAGLINDEDRRSANQVPGLSQLPGLGRLFSNNNDTVNKTEVVLLITPRVIRNIERPGVTFEEFRSGTEVEVGGAALGAANLPPIVVPSPTEKPAAPFGQSQPQPLPPAAGPQPKPQAQPNKE
jgi:general secretion pathway protein D